MRRKSTSNEHSNDQSFECSVEVICECEVNQRQMNIQMIDHLNVQLKSLMRSKSMSDERSDD